MAKEYTGSFSNPSWDASIPGTIREADLKFPSESMAIGEANLNVTVPSLVTVGCASQDVNRYLRWIVGVTAPTFWPYAAPPSVPDYRHNGKQVNFTFFDGHAETRTFTYGDPYIAGELAPYGGFGKLLPPTNKLLPNGAEYTRYDY